MANLCKSIYISLAVLFVCSPIEMYSPNYYVNSIEYYNMDTSQVEESSILEYNKCGVCDSTPTGSTDMGSSGSSNIYKTTLSLPILKVNDKRIYRMVKKSIKESLSFADFFQADSSGFFVVLSLQDSVSFCPLIKKSLIQLRIEPALNYYMYNVLFAPRYYYPYEFIGCFYYGKILCIVEYCCESAFEPTDIFVNTGENQMVNIYQKDLEVGMQYYGPAAYYYMKKNKWRKNVDM